MHFVQVVPSLSMQKELPKNTEIQAHYIKNFLP